jgi:hypothetical protein
MVTPSHARESELGAIKGFSRLPDEVFTLRADPLESRRSSQSDMRKALAGRHLE